MSSNADEASPAPRTGDELLSETANLQLDSSSPLVPKALKSAEPDLEVVVGQGDDMRNYHHHSVLLASYSDYVDTMLSVPMREQETRRITFPDITPANWDKIMSMHLLNGPRKLYTFLDKEEAPVLLPLLDKYQFNDVLGACDALLATMYDGLRHSDMTSGALEDTIAVAQAAHGLNPSCMELARPKIAEFAVKKLEAMPTSLSSAGVEVLLSLVDDNVSLRYFIEIANDDTARAPAPTTPLPGSEAVDLYIARLRQHSERYASDPNELRETTKTPCFADRLRMRTLQLSEQDEMMDRLIVKRLEVNAPQEFHDLNISGEYVRKGTEAEGGAIANFGKIAAAKKYSYIKHYTAQDGSVHKIVIAAVDLFGRAWVMIDSGPVVSSFLFFWENEFGSLIPPKYGWKKTPTRDSDPNSSFEGDGPSLLYHIESRAY